MKAMYFLSATRGDYYRAAGKFDLQAHLLRKTEIRTAQKGIVTGASLCGTVFHDPFVFFTG